MKSRFKKNLKLLGKKFGQSDSTIGGFDCISKIQRIDVSSKIDVFIKLYNFPEGNM